MPDIHPWDDAAAVIVQWLTDEPLWYAEALRAGHATPFAASVSEDQKLDYYRRQVFAQNPDGSVNLDQPNQAGRDMLIKRLGIKGYTQVMAAVLPRQRPPGVDEPEPMTSDLPSPESGEYGGY